MSNSARNDFLGVNEAGTARKIDTELTRRRSGPVRYELIGRDGQVWGTGYLEASQAAARAKALWPDQEQDEDRTGKGWDVQVIGS